jgi:hypothetical protein
MGRSPTQMGDSDMNFRHRVLPIVGTGLGLTLTCAWIAFLCLEAFHLSKHLF